MSVTRCDGETSMSHKSPDHFTCRVTWSPEDEEYLALEAAEQGISLNRLASAKLTG